MDSNPQVANLAAADLFEAAFRAMTGVGWEEGRWHVELRLEEGRVRRLQARRLNGEPTVRLGRSDLTRKSAV